jgi:phosphoribosylformylglycinamidine cyclo-ligase
MTTTYKDEVVAPGDAVSKLAHKINVRSYSNNTAMRVIPMQKGNFRGPVGHLWNEDLLMEMTHGVGHDWVLCEATENDGAGGKLGFHALADTEEAFEGAPWEMIAMTADDLARSGRFPAVLSNEMNVKRITADNLHLMKALLKGFERALKKAKLVSITGETAVMKRNVTCFCDTDDPSQLIVNWGATCLGLARKDLLITGEAIKPGLVVFGFHEKGYRCNGGTKFADIIIERWGPEPEKIVEAHDARAFAEDLATPSISYARAICKMVGWCDDGTAELKKYGEPLILGLAHITGGGVWKKFQEILPAGVGADLSAMPTPPRVLLEAQRYSQGYPSEIDDAECYGTFHGGCGMLGVCKESSFKEIKRIAASFGIKATKVGVTVASRAREIGIISRFLRKSGQYVYEKDMDSK